MIVAILSFVKYGAELKARSNWCVLEEATNCVLKIINFVTNVFRVPRVKLNFTVVRIGICSLKAFWDLTDEVKLR